MVLTLLFALQSAQLLQYGVKGGLTLTPDEDRKYFEGQGGERLPARTKSIFC